MILNRLRHVRTHANYPFVYNQSRFHSLDTARYQIATHQQEASVPTKEESSPLKNVGRAPSNNRLLGEIFPTTRVMPMVLSRKDSIVLSFDDVPGPKTLKYLSNVRQYLSQIGTQLTAGILTVGLNIGKYHKFNFTIPS